MIPEPFPVNFQVRSRKDLRRQPTPHLAKPCRWTHSGRAWHPLLTGPQHAGVNARPGLAP